MSLFKNHLNIIKPKLFLRLYREQFYFMIDKVQKFS